MTTPLTIGTCSFTHSLIQGPLAGVSCAPFRELFNLYTPPAYCVTEMLSAVDVITKHQSSSRYLYKSPDEGALAYQISGNDPFIMSEAALKLEGLGADIIDINCGCPKPKIRKKGAGSALLETPGLLIDIVSSIKQKLHIPLTVKIRLQSHQDSLLITKALQEAGADALIIHGRTAHDDYHTPCDYQRIQEIQQHLMIPVIANGDIHDGQTLQHAVHQSKASGYMIARAGVGRPWLFQMLLDDTFTQPSISKRLELFTKHLEQLAALESEFKALLEARTLIRYYFREYRDNLPFSDLFQATSITALASKLTQHLGK